MPCRRPRHALHGRPVERRKLLVERVAAAILGIVTLRTGAAAHGHPDASCVVKAWPVLSWAFLIQNPQNYMTAGGIWAPLVGTFYLVFISLAVAAPIGVLAGVYLNEYAGDNWGTRIVNLAVVNLAGVPSIVHALFGVGAFVLFAGMGRSVLAASCTLAIMTLPVIITSTREALAAVPQSFREACWNMGASRWQTIRTIVLPNAISGILTGVILQVSRAAGETAPILFTGAVFYVAVPETGLASYLPYGLWDRCMALSYHLFTISTQVTGVVRGAAVRHGRRAHRPRDQRQPALDRLPRLPARAGNVVSQQTRRARRTWRFATCRCATAPSRRSRDITLDMPRHAHLRHHRPGQLRQDDAPQVHQPHDRLRPGRARRAARC